jgi:hypothetical protein
MEALASFLLAQGGVATSWSSYQASLWSGIQAEDYGRASSLRVESSRASTRAGNFAIIDVGMFMQWLDARASGNAALEEFYRGRFRPEFRAAFEAWVATSPKENPDAEPTPFTQPEYTLADRKQASELDEKAEDTFAEGSTANDHSDVYVLNTVVFGVSMFFAGIVQQFRSKGAQVFLLGLSLGISVVGLWRLFLYPVAH